ncbi:hypothetical protein HMPREF1986_01564 [Oribacterium sp. oral taxon 078 str. F0263]|nr:hypothetical protein HMPREF1986_01564 [Oribacterium sp. oral taxon 078 str. F0263]
MQKIRWGIAADLFANKIEISLSRSVESRSYSLNTFGLFLKKASVG